MSRPRIVITAGEPAGIGPDLCVLLARESFNAELTILGDRAVLAERAARHGIAIDSLHVTSLPTRQPVQAGTLNAANAAHVLNLLDRATAGCQSGEFAAMVTAPVQKSIINDAGIPFTGHTEYLAEKTRTPHVVMMLIGGGMRVALASVHIPLKAVPDVITRDALTRTLRVLHHDLKTRFGIAQPRILLAGLNPHAGESGHLGREEIDTIVPVVQALSGEMHLEGPIPADTLFTPKVLARGDAVLAMYHDQGLAVLKHASFGGGVNVTLGLPIIRTSVDHGTALDLAGKRDAIEVGSMLAAVKLAITLATQRAT